MVPISLLSFMGLMIGLTLIPGANLMLVIQHSRENGRSAGFMAAWGGCLSVYIHALFSALGLSVILVNSVIALEVIRAMGSFYLIFLGLRAIIRSYRHQASPSVSATKQTGSNAFLNGFITNLLSPETTLFYFAVVPQFLDVGDVILVKVLLLASVHCVVRMLWYSTVAVGVERIRPVLLRPRVRIGIETVTGLMLVFFGVRLLIAKRIN